MTNKQLTKLQNKWVASTKDRKKIIAYDISLADLFKKVKKEKARDIIIDFITPVDGFLSPLCDRR